MFSGILQRLGNLGDVLLADADAFGHVEDGAVLGDAVDEGCAEMVVTQQSGPLGKPQLGGDDGAGSAMAHFDQMKE